MNIEITPITILIVNTLRYFVLAGLPFVIFYLLFPNSFLVNKVQDKIATNKDFIREIMHSMQTTVIFAFVGGLILQTSFRDYTQIYTDINAYPIWWVPVSLFLAMLVHDAYFYWLHRAMHHPRWYKAVHLVHHKSTNPSPWASYSFHAFEGFLEAFAASVILFIVPMHPLSMIIFVTLSFVYNVYGHLGYEIAPKWFRRTPLFGLLNTSTHHNLHHERVEGNYGLYFRIWDRMMGTEIPDYVTRYDEIQDKRLRNEVRPKTEAEMGNISYHS